MSSLPLASDSCMPIDRASLIDNEACGIANNQNVPCPALGARRYIYFSPEDPTTQQVLPMRVPDFITTVPPLGWTRIPE